MTTQGMLAARFETERAGLRGVAFRLLGSATEADDAVQEAWLRLGRVDAGEIDNLAAWLRTVVSRVCLDMLRARRADPVAEVPEEVWAGADPAEEAVLVEEVGRALLVVLSTLSPAERVAFVLHDLFAVPFTEIAPLLDRSAATTKKLASRARQRVRGVPPVDAEAQRHTVDAFLAAARDGDLTGLLAVLAPDVVRTADRVALPSGPLTARGAGTIAAETVHLGRRSRFAAVALVDGAVGVVVASRGRLTLALTVTVVGGRITAYDVIGEPARLLALSLAVID